MKKKIMIEGMSCQHCVAQVTEALASVAFGGVKVNLEDGYAVIDTDDSDDDIISAVDDAGYDVLEIVEL